MIFKMGMALKGNTIQAKSVNICHSIVFWNLRKGTQCMKGRWMYRYYWDGWLDKCKWVSYCIGIGVLYSGFEFPSITNGPLSTIKSQSFFFLFTFTHCLSHICTHTLSYTHSLSCTTFSYCIKHTVFLTHIQTYNLTHSHTLSCTLCLSHAHTLTHSLS